MGHLVQDGAIHPERHSRTMRLPSIPERTIKFQRVEIQPGEEPLPTSECWGGSCPSTGFMLNTSLLRFHSSLIPFTVHGLFILVVSIAASVAPHPSSSPFCHVPPNPVQPDLSFPFCPVQFLQNGSLTPGACSACRLGGEDRQPWEDLLH